jgi:hypothetical protein
MDFHERAMKALEKRAGTFHCIDCWAKAASLTSPEDHQQLSGLARTMATTTDPASETGDCEVCQEKKKVRVVRVLPPRR